MLLDQYGQPLRPPAKREVEEELTAPSTASIRQIQSGHPADGLRPQKLARILRQAEISDPTEYLQLAEQLEEKDMQYASVLRTRKLAVRNLELQVNAADESDQAEEAAALVRKTLNGSAFRTALIDIMDAVAKGFSVHELIWAWEGRRIELKQFKYRDPTWFRFDREDGETLRYLDDEGELDMPPGRFLVHRSKTKSGLTIRGGLARAAVWPWMFKSYSLRDWAIFVTTYGHPLRVGKYDANATADDKKTLLRAVQRVGTDMAAIFPRSMEIEFQQAAMSGGTDLFERKAEYWDRQISKLVLGQTATTDAIAGGHAVGKIHEQVRDDIRDADGEQLAATIEQDIAKPLVAWNFGPNVACPEISLVAAEEHDPRTQMAAIKMFGPMGLPVSKSFVQERFGIREAEDDEELLEFGTPSSPPGTGFAENREPTKPRPRDPETGEQVAALGDTATPLDRLLGRVSDGDFSDVTDPVILAFLEAMETAETVEQMRDLLDDLAEQAPDGALAELFARLGFMSRLAGELNVAIDRPARGA